MLVERQVSNSRCKHNNDVIKGPGYLSNNDITWVQANSTGVPPDQKVDKAEELTYPSTNIALDQTFKITQEKTLWLICIVDIVGASTARKFAPPQVSYNR